MPRNKLANIVADYLYLNTKGGEKVCRLFLEATEYAKKEGLDLKDASIEELVESIKHNLKDAVFWRDKKRKVEK